MALKYLSLPELWQMNHIQSYITGIVFYALLSHCWKIEDTKNLVSWPPGFEPDPSRCDLSYPTP